MESNQHPNANGSRWLALITALLYIGLNVLAFSVYHPVSWQWYASDIFFGLCCTFSIFINVNDTFETHENWKTWLAIIFIVATFLLTVLPISSHVN
jgi:multisubunit Na+/H+ antiporter MnhE subunit